MNKHLILIFTTFLYAITAFSQSDASLKAVATEVSKQKTANSKDILTTFFQASLDNLLGQNHSFTLNSSFYGIDSIFRGKNGKPLSSEKERTLKHFSFNIGLVGDSSNNITQYGGGFSIVLLDKKDVKRQKMLAEDLQKLEQLSLFTSAFKRSIRTIIAAAHPAAIADPATNRKITQSLNEADNKNDYSNLDPLIVEALNDPGLVSSISSQKARAFPKVDPDKPGIIDSVNFIMSDETIADLINRIRKGNDVFQQIYEEIAESYRNKPLWTINPTLSYDRVNKQAEYAVSSNFTVGLWADKGKKPWELEANASFRSGKDSAIKESNNNNRLFSLSVGINKVLMQTEEKESMMEFKLFSQYDHQFGEVAAEVKNNIFTLNSTLRINVFKSLWLPVTLRYDPVNSNFIGVFAITANLGN